MSYYDFERQYFGHLNSIKAQLESRPLILGGISSGGGGSGGPPGGFVGVLPQGRVAYDSDELADITTSGFPTLLDNLNHIRARLEQVESSGSGGGSSGHIILYNGVPMPARSSLDFEGINVTITDDIDNDRTIVTISGTGGAGGIPITGNGGIIEAITVSGINYYKHTFYIDGTFTAPDELTNIDVIIVGAGGGGSAGGGGGGGVIVLTNIDPNPSTDIVVGGGGSGRSPYTTFGDNGADSSFGTTIAYGGGGGGQAGDTDKNGIDGASGGGGGFDGADALWVGGSAVHGSQGHSGGSNGQYHGAPYPAGGGGGSDTAGLDATDDSHAGQGGDGIVNNFSGTDTYYGGGGGGGMYSSGGTPGDGGNGGGGQAGDDASDGYGGEVNTGGGGGGAGNGKNGGSGGTGIVIIRYPVTLGVGSSGATGTFTTVDSKTVTVVNGIITSIV